MASLVFTTMYADKVVVFEENSAELIVPERSIGTGSLQISSNAEEQFLKWNQDHSKDSYVLMQRITRIWNATGTTDYFMYGKVSKEIPFSYEIVPFPPMRFPFIKQFSVLWNISFGGKSLSLEERQLISNTLIATELAQPVEENIPTEYDAFCHPEVIQRQLVFEGRYVYVLYNYAPISMGNKLHFLLVPKTHRLKLADLQEEEYLEMQALTQALVAFYQDEGESTAFLFNKSGASAGQTVPHFHQHVVFTANKTEEVYGRLIVLKNMLFGSSPLPSEELESRVASLRETLAPVLADCK